MHGNPAGNPHQELSDDDGFDGGGEDDGDFGEDLFADEDIDLQSRCV